MIIVLLGNGFRRLDPGMPIAGSCSVAISAACHAHEGDGVALQKLMHGVLEDKEDGKPRVGFSGKPVTPLQDGVIYSYDCDGFMAVDTSLPQLALFDWESSGSEALEVPRSFTSSS